MNDLFEIEQMVLDISTEKLQKMTETGICSVEDYEELLKEYGKSLRQLRRMQRIFDQSTVGMNTSNQKLTNEVNIDALTGLYNRGYLDRTLKSIVEDINNYSENLGIIMMDIDYFKKYNDAYGHDGGDDCLRKVAKALKSCIRRKQDFVARYGGEEFTVVLPKTDEDGIRLMCERLRTSVLGMKIPHKGSDVNEFVSISMGATVCSIRKSEDPAEIIKVADNALYESKTNGRNRYTFLAVQ
jgi:diguanylate cyclase (GGDEF)-like protein